MGKASKRRGGGGSGSGSGGQRNNNNNGKTNANNNKSSTSSSTSQSSSSKSSLDGGSAGDGSAYARYKQKTRAFRDGLAKLLPVDFQLTYVSDLGKAVEYVFETLMMDSHNNNNNNNNQSNITANDDDNTKNKKKKSKESKSNKAQPLWIPKDLLLDLNDTIEMRESFTQMMVSSSKRGGQDDGDDCGHKYMMQMLKYCQSILTKCREVSQKLNTEFRLASKKLRETTTNNNDKTSISPCDHKEGEDLNVETTTTTTTGGGRFEALRLDGDDDDDDDDDDDEDNDDEGEEIMSSSVKEENKDDEHSQAETQPQKPTEPKKRYSIEKDLIEGSYRWQAFVFLFTIDILFKNVNHQYKNLKKRLRKLKRMITTKNNSNYNEDNNNNDDTIYIFKDEEGNGIQTNEIQTTINSSIIIELIGKAAMINMALEDFVVFEQSLYLDCPQFKSFYHVLAAFVWSEHELFLKLQNKINPKILSRRPTIVLNFIADCMEGGFRSPGDPLFWKENERDAKFAKSVGLTLKDVILPSRVVRMNAFYEAAPEYMIKKSKELIPDFKRMSDIIENEEPLLCGKNKWLVAFKGIGGENSILHTHCLLQSFTYGMKDGFGGAEGITDDDSVPAWDGKTTEEGGGVIAKTTTDPIMDDLICCYIIPELFQCSRRNKRCLEKDVMSRIFPLHRTIEEYLESKDHSVPLSASLSLHALVLSIFHLQGEMDVEDLALLSKSVYEAFNEKVKAQVQTNAHYNKAPLIRAIAINELIVSPTSSSVPTAATLRAVWNPLMAGCNLLYIAYVGSLRCGTDNVDCFYQARIFTHLYHALCKRGVMKPSYVFDRISVPLCRSKLIWPTSEEPIRGSFTKTFMLSIGDTLKTAAKMAEVVQLGRKDIVKREMAESSLVVGEDDPEAGMSHLKVLAVHSMRGLFQRRKSAFDTTVKPEEVCQTYKYIFNRDFEDLPKEQQEETYATPLESNLFDHVRQIRALCFAMHVDNSLIGLNWPLIAGYLNMFADEIIERMGWSTLIDQYIKDSGMYKEEAEGNLIVRRDVLVLVLADKVFGELDFEDDDSKLEASNDVAQLMSEYFNKADDLFWPFYTPSESSA